MLLFDKDLQNDGGYEFGIFLRESGGFKRGHGLCFSPCNVLLVWYVMAEDDFIGITNSDVLIVIQDNLTTSLLFVGVVGAVECLEKGDAITRPSSWPF